MVAFDGAQTPQCGIAGLLGIGAAALAFLWMGPRGERNLANPLLQLI